jgi:hypothetical protein
MLLTQLPPEILHNILSLVELDDLTAIQLTCRFLNNFIQGNNALCRAIYLRLFVCLLAHSSSNDILRTDIRPRMNHQEKILISPKKSATSSASKPSAHLPIISSASPAPDHRRRWPLSIAPSPGYSRMP